MQASITALEQIIKTYAPQLAGLNDADFSLKPSTKKWSKKELLGHLVDSAQNNIRRFVVSQYENDPHIVYAQDFWVDAAAYQQYPLRDLVELWTLLNKHLCIVLKNMPAEAAKRTCITGEQHTIEWLAHDYNQHLRYHLHQLLELEPVPYP
jgi:hypothetical protein